MANPLVQIACLLAQSSFAVANQLSILTFHALDEQVSAISFPPRRFRWGMEYLHASGYKTLALAEIRKCLRRQLPFPERSFGVTFDDGYQSVYDQAFPVLQQYGFGATVFLTTGEDYKNDRGRRLPSMSGRSMLSWDEIREMQRFGIEFGAHTLTHRDLARLPDEHIEVEVSGSRRIIEEALGAPAQYFAYPYGRYNDRVREIVRQHFSCACSDRLGLAHRKSDLFAIERVDAYYLRGVRLFNLLSSGLFPWYVRARNVPRQFRRSAQFIWKKIAPVCEGI